MSELHNTVMGRKLIDHTLPNIGIQLERIANAMESNTKDEKKELIEFLEYVEAMTICKETRERIEKFMRKNGYWRKN